MRALARVVVFIPRMFEADMGRREGLSTSEFFVLMHLSEQPGGALRMGEIADRTALSPGAVTRVLKLLEGKGLATRRRAAMDGRGSEALLTAAGIAELERLRPTYVADGRRRVLDKLRGVDLRAAAEVLDRIGRDHGEPATTAPAARSHA